jgi:hypothetical protein
MPQLGQQSEPAGQTMLPHMPEVLEPPLPTPVVITPVPAPPLVTLPPPVPWDEPACPMGS